jgi:hypothetical protein
VYLEKTSGFGVAKEYSLAAIETSLLIVRQSQWWRWSLLEFFSPPSAVVIGLRRRVLGSSLLFLRSSGASK